MMYVSVNIFTVHAGAMEPFLALQRDTFLPLLRGHAGFAGFEVIQTGEDTGVTTLWWASEEARRAATPALGDWVQQHLTPYFVVVENPAGPLVLSWRATELDAAGRE